jgi:hypothetical protein
MRLAVCVWLWIILVAALPIRRARDLSAYLQAIGRLLSIVVT